MFRKYIIPLIALAGVAFAVFTVLRGDKTPPQPPPVSDAPQPPFQTFVAGSGIVEASTENISIGTHIAGIVSKIFVQIGSNVKAGDPLFTIDDRSMLADIEAPAGRSRLPKRNSPTPNTSSRSPKRSPPVTLPAPMSSKRNASPRKRPKRNWRRRAPN